MTDTGAFIKIELERIQKQANEGLICNLRGYGTYLGFDSDYHDILLKYFDARSINVASCGKNTIVIKPSLILTPTQAAHLRDALDHFHPNCQ